MKILMNESEKNLETSVKNLLESKGFEVEILNSHANELTYGNTTLHLLTNTLTCKENAIQLSATEFDVIRLLMKNPPHNHSKAYILSHVWGYNSYAVENYVEVYIGHLRKKLREIGSNIQIVSVRKLGYHLEIYIK